MLIFSEDEPLGEGLKFGISFSSASISFTEEDSSSVIGTKVLLVFELTTLAVLDPFCVASRTLTSKVKVAALSKHFWNTILC